ncbi:cupin domain-containing protein [Actinacidiphila glaucinigra]|uniref:cupin domain-containing protein n=1 Tax=Actinacidiphila glaucinigra TaxID=235986 RepID=UPI003404B694
MAVVHYQAAGTGTALPPDRAQAMTLLVQYPPGHPGIPPHRPTGPAFGYVIEGEMLFEPEGEPERVVRAGESFWEPGADVIHV